LIESATILDFLDETAGPERALLPRSGEPRREALRIIAIAVGGAEKGVLQVYENAFRPPEKRYRPWVERCHTQTHAALAELDRLCQVRGGEWLIGNRITQADITVTCAYTFLGDALDINRDAVAYPALNALAARCEALPEFRSVKADWFAPGDP
jgi:glutathione S-transferase